MPGPGVMARTAAATPKARSDMRQSYRTVPPLRRGTRCSAVQRMSFGPPGGCQRGCPVTGALVLIEERHSSALGDVEVAGAVLANQACAQERVSRFLDATWKRAPLVTYTHQFFEQICFVRFQHSHVHASRLPAIGNVLTSHR